MNRSTINKLVLALAILTCLLVFIVTVDASFKQHKKFAKHLFKFVKKEKKFFKKKGLEAAALIAMSGFHKKKIPLPFPLPIP